MRILLTLSMLTFFGLFTSCAHNHQEKSCCSKQKVSKCADDKCDLKKSACCDSKGNCKTGSCDIKKSACCDKSGKCISGKCDLKKKKA